jgi:hypothetical protein
VADDVNSVFKGKTLTQLGLLGEQIKGKLKGGEGIDVGTFRVNDQKIISLKIFLANGGHSKIMQQESDWSFGLVVLSNLKIYIWAAKIPKI